VKLAKPSADTGHDVALRELAKALAPYLRELLALEHRDEDLVDVLEMLPRARRSERRAAQGACRDGSIPGAAKVARRWRAPRASVLAWLQTLGPRSVPMPVEGDGDDLEPLRRSLSTSGRRRRTG
jgi:hypothetical protein